MKFYHGKNLKLINKKTIFIDKNVVIGNNVVIYENTRIEGNTVIGDNCVIKPNCYINNCKIGNNVLIISSYLTDSYIGDMCEIGPFARLRPNTELKHKVKIGNFVEIKNSIINDGCKISHLAYVGDADLGENCNIGCGVIFANYNGKTKNRTRVGNNCFIGSNCNLIAPLNIDDDCYICAGTTVTDDIKKGGFVIGRSKQIVKEGRAYSYLKLSKGE